MQKKFFRHDSCQGNRTQTMSRITSDGPARLNRQARAALGLRQETSCRTGVPAFACIFPPPILHPHVTLQPHQPVAYRACSLSYRLGHRLQEQSYLPVHGNLQHGLDLVAFFHCLHRYGFLFVDAIEELPSGLTAFADRMGIIRQGFDQNFSICMPHDRVFRIFIRIATRAAQGGDTPQDTLNAGDCRRENHVRHHNDMPSHVGQTRTELV